jgi:molybdate transport system ATP-binding protein
MLSVSLQHRLEGFALDVAFDAPPGVTVLFGPSGSGKTTVINAVAGLLRPDAGRIVVGDRVLLDTARGVMVPPHRRRLGYIFQEGRLFPHLTVRQNLLFGRWFAPRDARTESLDDVVEMLGIGHLLHRRPGALSGGEKSRVAIGRALLAAPRLILADEPLAALDDARKAEVLASFERLRAAIMVPILYVTHSRAEVARLATTVVALRAGRVVAVGTPAQVLGLPQVTGPRGVESVLPARVVALHADGLLELASAAGTLWLAPPPGATPATGARVQVRISAQDVLLATEVPRAISAQNILPATIAGIDGDDSPMVTVHLSAGGTPLHARLTRRALSAMALAPGQRVHAIIKSAALDPGDAI